MTRRGNSGESLAQNKQNPLCFVLFVLVLCAADTCFNGGKCSEEGPHMCQCPAGFQGPRCQYGESNVNHCKCICDEVLLCA